MTSPSSRRAWIEIDDPAVAKAYMGVALLAEGVDRNAKAVIASMKAKVALLAEGVDRNRFLPMRYT